jgi:hypothetical protein
MTADTAVEIQPTILHLSSIPALTQVTSALVWLTYRIAGNITVSISSPSQNSPLGTGNQADRSNHLPP